MTTLIVTICLGLTGPCEDRSLPLVAPEASPLSCMLRAPAIVADGRVLGLRGDQRVARWRCEA